MSYLTIADTHLYKKIGESCNSNWRSCPYGSHCDDVSDVCVCDDGLLMNDDKLYCRPAVFGEQCGRAVCDVEAGLQCQGHPALCTCALGYHGPDAWTRFINRRWRHADIGLTPLACIASKCRRRVLMFSPV